MYNSTDWNTTDWNNTDWNSTNSTMYDEYPMEEDWDYYYEDLPDFEDFDLEDWDYDYDYDYMPDDYYYDGYMGYDTYASYDYGGYMNDTQEE